MSITFSNPSKSQKTVNKLLSKVLPGHATSTSSPNTRSKASTSQQLTASHNSTTSHKVLKQQKKKQKQVIKISQEQRVKLMAEAQRRVLKEHSQSGKLTREESIELKKYVKKNVVDVTSWQNEDEDLEELQREILELKGDKRGRLSKRAKKTSDKKDSVMDLYKKDMIRYPGLTPGLAPVGMDDESDSHDSDASDAYDY